MKTKIARVKSEKTKVSQLAQDSFVAVRPFINIFDCGYEKPFHAISRRDWDFHRRHKAGERGLLYESGREFHPYNDIIRNIFSEDHVERNLWDKKTVYYTSERKGRALLYGDIDAHHEWQTDEEKAVRLTKQIFPNDYERPSWRGHNFWLKVRYNSPQQLNEIAYYLEQQLKSLFNSEQILCDVEIKGTITTKEKSGRLGKLPFATMYPCHKRNENDSWNYVELKRFMSAPCLQAQRLERIAQNFNIDYEKAEKWTAYKKICLLKTSCPERQLKKSCRADGKKLKLNPSEKTQELSTSSNYKRESITSDGLNTYKKGSNNTGKELAQCGHKSIRQLQCCLSQREVLKKKGISQADAASIGEQKTSVVGRGEAINDIRNIADAFLKDHKFVMWLARRLRRVPTLKEALSANKKNNIFNGQWEDGLSERRHRYKTIIPYVAQTFDQEKCGAKSQRPELDEKVKKWRGKAHCFTKTIRASIHTASRIDEYGNVSEGKERTVTVQRDHVLRLAGIMDHVSEHSRSGHDISRDSIQGWWNELAELPAWKKDNKKDNYYYLACRNVLVRMGWFRIDHRYHRGQAKKCYEVIPKLVGSEWSYPNKEYSTTALLKGYVSFDTSKKPVFGIIDLLLSSRPPP